nr:MAG TPA: chitin synthase regulator [Caudoviricetes sp.]
MFGCCIDLFIFPIAAFYTSRRRREIKGAQARRSRLPLIPCCRSDKSGWRWGYKQIHQQSVDNPANRESPLPHGSLYSFEPLPPLGGRGEGKRRL